MSIDNFFFVYPGVRDEGKGRWQREQYKTYEEMLADGAEVPPNQVFLAHGAHYLIDDQFYFPDPEDARWFWERGYKEMLFEDEHEPDHMDLWIDDEHVGSRVLGKEVGKDA
jgi:hypothetical protein